VSEAQVARWPEHALALHLLLQHFEGLIDIVVPDESLHVYVFSIERFNGLTDKLPGSTPSTKNGRSAIGVWHEQTPIFTPPERDLPPSEETAVSLTLSPLWAGFGTNSYLAYRDRQLCQCPAKQVSRNVRSAADRAPSFLRGRPQSWSQRKSLSIQSRCFCPRGKSPSAKASAAAPYASRQRKNRDDRSLMVQPCKLSSVLGQKRR
jgi:hypothetical protein